MQPIHRRSRLLKQNPAIGGVEIESGTPSDGDLLVFDAATNEWLLATDLPAANYRVTGGYFEVRKDSATLYPQLAAYNGENNVWAGLGVSGSLATYEAGETWLYSDSGLVLDANNGGTQARMHLHDVSAIGHVDVTGGSYFRAVDAAGTSYVRLRSGASNGYFESSNLLILHMLNSASDFHVQSNFISKLTYDISANVWMFRDGAQIRAYDSTDVDYIAHYHDGTSAYTTFNGALHWNIQGSGLTGRVNLNSAPLYIQPDGAGGSTDGDILIYFNIDRDWSFRVNGDDGACNLALQLDSNAKAFYIQDRFAEPKFWFAISDTGGVFRILDSTTTANANAYVNFGNDGTDLNTEAGSAIVDWNITGFASVVIDGDSGPALALKGGTADHVYLEFYADAAAQTTRSAYFGFPSATFETIYLTNEFDSGHVLIAGYTAASAFTTLIDADPDEGVAFPTGYPYFSGAIYNKTAQTDRTSTTTLADDPHLSGIALPANGRYRITFEMLAYSTSATPDIKVGLQFSVAPASGGWWMNSQTYAAASSPVMQVVGSTSNVATIPLDGTSAELLTGVIDVTIGGTASVLDIQWAQNTSDATATTIFGDGWVKVERYP